MNPHFWTNAKDVFILFLVPVGGGIPAGVILAKSRGIAWPVMMFLYLISDIVLACVFEPILLSIKKLGEKFEKLGRFNRALKEAMDKSILRYGVNPGPFTLIMISFGVDPMTGRAAALASGHHFIAGWSFAIAGDMIFFAVLMVSTLWLNSILGDGLWTAVIITAAMFIIPVIYRKLRKSKPTGPI